MNETGYQRSRDLIAQIKTELHEYSHGLLVAQHTLGMDDGIDIVVGYLLQASDDVCRLGEAFCRQYVSDQEIDLLAALAVRSIERFHQAFGRWKKICLD